MAMFKLFTSIKINISQGGFLQRMINITSSLSFGIYLVHIAIMRNLLWKMDFIINIQNYYFQWLAIVCLTFLGSWGVCYCISLLPFGGFIIGFKQKRK